MEKRTNVLLKGNLHYDSTIWDAVHRKVYQLQTILQNLFNQWRVQVDDRYIKMQAEYRQTPWTNFYEMFIYHDSYTVYRTPESKTNRSNHCFVHKPKTHLFAYCVKHYQCFKLLSFHVMVDHVSPILWSNYILFLHKICIRI